MGQGRKLLLRDAWATVELFFNPGHYMGQEGNYYYEMHGLQWDYSLILVITWGKGGNYYYEMNGLHWDYSLILVIT